MANTEPTISFSIKEDREKELKRTARALIRHIDRDELLQVLLRSYLER